MFTLKLKLLCQLMVQTIIHLISGGLALSLFLGGFVFVLEAVTLRPWSILAIINTSADYFFFGALIGIILAFLRIWLKFVNYLLFIVTGNKETLGYGNFPIAF